MQITQTHLQQLIHLESQVHYGVPPPPEESAFITVRRPSRVLLSAPHGARTFRNCETEAWHEEDEYTAGMALLLAEVCGTSVVATIWRTDDCDPNYHSPCAYKEILASLISKQGIRWVIDLHGAGPGTLPHPWRVDLGSRNKLHSLPPIQRQRLTDLLEQRLGAGSVSHNRFPASRPKRTITAFSHGELGVHAVQVEMAPSVRVPCRRVDGSAYAREGHWMSRPGRVISMMQALADFIDVLNTTEG